MPAARYTWMFRAAAVVYLVLGAGAIWRFGFTDFDPAHRLWGIGCGVAAILIGVFLLRRARLAIVLSAINAAFIALAATLAAPSRPGPVILAFALVALLFGAYAVLAARCLLTDK